MEYKRKMDVISSYRPRKVTLSKIDGDEEGFDYLAIDVPFEEATVEVEMVKDQILNFFSSIIYYYSRRIPGRLSNGPSKKPS